MSDNIEKDKKIVTRDDEQTVGNSSKVEKIIDSPKSEEKELETKEKNEKQILDQETVTKIKSDGNAISPEPAKSKPKKEVPIEKKPFNEFINDYLIPSLIEEFKNKDLEIDTINLKNTIRPVAGDLCWVVYCEIKETCNFWLSFEKDDISSLKSISLCKSNQKPSVLESFLIDEKRITLKLIISRILQRLNGQKLIGVN